MKASKFLRKPKNWEDFEELCLRLWGEIWGKPDEIDFNSTNDQGQAGVDIFCWVDKLNGYAGIQCKGKKDERIDGSKNRLKLKDLLIEIQKAEKFEPQLKKYIIATSAEMDGEIQKEIRKIDEERREQGLFSVEIKFWDYISRKVDEFKPVHDWYVKSQGFKRNSSIRLVFDNGLEETCLKPAFKQKVYHHVAENPFKKLEELYSPTVFKFIKA